MNVELAVALVQQFGSYLLRLAAGLTTTAFVDATDVNDGLLAGSGSVVDTLDFDGRNRPNKLRLSFSLSARN